MRTPNPWDMWVMFLIRGGNLLDAVAARLVSEYRQILRHPKLVQFLLSASCFPVLVGVQSLLNWVPALQLAYVIPVSWASKRYGYRGGLVMAGLAVLAGFLADKHQLEPDLLLLIASAATRFAVLSAIVYLVTSQETKIRVASETAHRDHLTGALNRLGFIVAGQFAIESAIQRQSSATVSVIDLNRFKQLNDQFGHDFGDRVLHQLVKALQRHLPPNSIIGRMGGDEFSIVLPDTLPEQAEVWLRQAHDRFSDITLVLGHRSTFSYGIVEVPKGASNLEMALAEADRRMYLDKQYSAV